MAIALLCGYFALLLTGILFISFKENSFAYDAIVHAYFLGFVFSMIFAHGPIILPGVLGIPAKPFHRLMYLWLAMLQLSWLMRLVADVLLEPSWRKISGMLGAVTILFYFFTVAVMTIRTRYAKIV